MTALRDLTASAVMMGLLAAFVGYSASFAIVMAAMEAMDASEAQAATGLFYATLAMGLCSLVLPLITRAPSAIAWSTPGAAFLASSATLPGGFGEALGALITCGVLILITGLIPAEALAQVLSGAQIGSGPDLASCTGVAVDGVSGTAYVVDAATPALKVAR